MAPGRLRALDDEGSQLRAQMDLNQELDRGNQETHPWEFQDSMGEWHFQQEPIDGRYLYHFLDLFFGPM